MYELGLVGNCQISALIDKKASVVWMCAPRPDSPPVFGRLLDDEGGGQDIEVFGANSYRQEYLTNTNILETKIEDDSGSAMRIIDFCPRFEQYGRVFRPPVLIRIIEPVRGQCRIKLNCSPVQGWSKEASMAQRGNSHLRYPSERGVLRVHTDAPLTYLTDDISFLLQETVTIVISWDAPFEADLKFTAYEFLDRTSQYWRRWVKHCSIPVLFQKEVIRSALALKIHCYEDTGAILAATTTSLPEAIGHERNWDYRFCWLRDAFFTLSAFNRLGHFEEMEGFLKFLINVQLGSKDIAPVYGLDMQLPLPERSHDKWNGFGGSKPVRSNNAAAEQIQYDVYGEIILALTPVYLDERFSQLRTRELDDVMAWLGAKCIESVGRPDAGLWELRGFVFEHSFTNLMCWAGLDRIERVLISLKRQVIGNLSLADISKAKAFAESRLRVATKEKILRNGIDDLSLDASLLLLPVLRFPDVEVCSNTVQAIARDLRCKSKQDKDGETTLLYRYLRTDDFGQPESAFLICSFWLAQAYGKLGMHEQGRSLVQRLSHCANHVGLLAEHYLDDQGMQLGNFPQAYSHVGLINSAFELSPAWADVL
jgi:GH15 family glucan-1,4-alpha-glucosidase